MINFIRVLIVGVLFEIILFSCTHSQYRINRYEYLKSEFDSVDIANKKIIDSLGFVNLENNGRYLLYLKNYDERLLCEPKYLIPENIFVSYLDFKLADVTIKNDTLDLYYKIVYNDTLPISQCSRNDEIFYGISINVGTKEIIGFLINNGYYKDLNLQGNFKYPLSDTAKTFFRKNKEKLNSWFKSQLIEKKVI
jgi:hypothetical protein